MKCLAALPLRERLQRLGFTITRVTPNNRYKGNQVTMNGVVVHPQSTVNYSTALKLVQIIEHHLISHGEYYNEVY